jgi:hypothetical protein
MPLTSRERVLAVLDHEIPDHLPIVIGVSNATGISNPTYRKSSSCSVWIRLTSICTTGPNSARQR